MSVDSCMFAIKEFRCPGKGLDRKRGLMKFHRVRVIVEEKGIVSFKYVLY